MSRILQGGSFVLLYLWATNLNIVQGVYHPEVKASSFCYDEPFCGKIVDALPEMSSGYKKIRFLFADAKTWGGLCKTGQEQSPINIEFHKTTEFQPTVFTMNDHYLLERMHKFYAQNNGHTAQFQLQPNNSDLKSHLTIGGGELNGDYKLAQFHFHWAEKDDVGSEHTVMGKRYPLELHLVHYKSTYSSLSNALASNDREAVAVMAVFYQVGRKHNKHLKAIIESLYSLHEPGDVKEFHFPLQISELYPLLERRDFARYLGSLTTPTCDEKVVWTVFLEPAEISEGQINQFRKLSNHEGNSDFNFRPLQPLNHRQVEFYRKENFERYVKFTKPWLTGNHS